MSVSASASPVNRHSDMLRREAGIATSHHSEMGSFESYDVDHDGYLGSKEAQTLLQDMEIDPAMWHMYAGKKDGLISRLAYERLADDLKVFRTSDKDTSDHLEPEEIEALEKEAGLHEPQGSFSWRTFDIDKDNKLSKAEFLAAGPAAARAAAHALAGSSLLSTDDNSRVADPEWQQEEDAEAEADGWAWASADDEGPGEQIDLGMMEGDPHHSTLMEGSEVDDMMHDMDSDDEKGLSLLEEDEEDEHDEDLDGALPEPDYDEEGESLLEEDEQQALDYLMNDDLDLNVEDERRVASELFQAFDSDNNGELDASEIGEVLERAGVPKFDWQSYDHNSDHKLSQDEFYSMGKDEGNKDNPDLMDGILAQLYEEPDDDGSITESSADSDDSQDNSADESSDAAESASESATTPAPESASDAIADLDAIGKTSQTSSADEDDSEEKDDLEVFEQFDENHDGKLSGDELQEILTKAHKQGWNWKQFDTDGDGELSKKEFQTAAHEFNTQD